MGGYLSNISENTLIKRNATEDSFSVRLQSKKGSDNEKLNCESN